MHIEDIFEDLEAQFAATIKESQTNSFHPDSNLLVVQTITKQNRELLAPLLGHDFIAGLCFPQPHWNFYPLGTLGKIVFKQIDNENFPALRNIDKSLSDFLCNLKLPCSLRWQLKGSDTVQMGALHEIKNGLLKIHAANQTKQFFVPLASLTELSIRIVDNQSSQD